MLCTIKLLMPDGVMQWHHNEIEFQQDGLDKSLKALQWLCTGGVVAHFGSTVPTANDLSVNWDTSAKTNCNLRENTSLTPTNEHQ